MKIRNEFNSYVLCSRQNPFPVLLVLLAMATAACTTNSEPFSIVDFKSDEMVANYTKTFLMSGYKSDSLYSTALLAEKGDLFITTENSLFVFTDPSQTEYVIKNKKNAAYLNDKLISISIPGNDSLIQWIKTLPDNDIKSLGFIFFRSSIRESYIPCLTDLAKLNPGIGLGYEGDISEMKSLFNIFRPTLLVGASVSPNDFKILSALKSLVILDISPGDTVYSEPLPPLPVLKTLILSDINANTRITNMLSNNKQIEKLVINSAHQIDLSLLGPLDNLKELIISDVDTIINFDLIKNQKRLEVLSINGEHPTYDKLLDDLNAIKWIGFSPGVMQNEFDSFIDHHPGLEVVQIINNKNISNLQPLIKLNKLIGLEIADTLADFETLKSLKNLRYLSMPEEVLSDTTRKAELEKYLPRTRLVATQGVCLGSGWLLLLIPFVLIVTRFSGLKTHRTRNSRSGLYFRHGNK